MAKDFSTKIMVLKERWDRLEAIGIADQFFVTYHEHKEEVKRQKILGIADEKIEKPFIYMRPMRDRPHTKDDIEKNTDIVHMTLTGWGNQYNIRHPRYFKIPYSSHSSGAELDTFVKIIRPKNLIFNLCHFLNDPYAVNVMALMVSYTENCPSEFIKVIEPL